MLIFSTDYRQGSLVEKVNKIVPTLTGTVPFSKAEKGMALRSRQAGDYNYGAITAFNNIGTNSFSVEVAFTYWGYKNIGSSDNCLLGNSTNTTTNGISFIFNSADRISVVLTSGSGVYSIISTDAATPFKIGKNYLLSVVFDGVTYRCFVNGLLQTSNSTTVRNITSTSNFYIGAESSTTQRRSNADIYFLRIHNSVLSQQEINASYNNFLAGDGYLTQKRNISAIKPTDLSSEVNKSVSIKIPSINLSSGWSVLGACTINNSTTFTNTNDGGVLSVVALIPGLKYRVIIKGTTTNTIFQIRNSSGTNIYYVQSNGTIDTIFTFTATTGDNFYIRGQGAGVTTITELELQELTGLVAAYNMVPNGNTLVDISGNGYNLAKTLGGSNTSKKGMTNTGKENWTSTPTISLDTDFSLSFRVLKKHTGTTLNTLLRTTNGTTTGIWVYLDSGVNGRLTIDNNVTPAHFNGALPVVGQEYTITLTYINSSNTTNCYINGVFFATSTAYAPTSPRTSILRVLYSGGAGNDNGLSELQDLKIYNRILTIQEIKDYHNSFNDITLIEDFSDCPADNVTSVVPTGWEKISGAFKIGEHTMANSELVINGGFDTDTVWAKDANWKILNGTANYDALANTKKISQLLSTVVGKRYKISFAVKSGTARLSFNSTTGSVVFNEGELKANYPVGVYNLFVTVATATALGIYAYNDNGGTACSIDNISVIEVPPLTTIQNGTKYLECLTPGVISIPSQQSYGTWEADVFKGSTLNTLDVYLISSIFNSVAGVAGTGYNFRLSVDEEVLLSKRTNGSGVTLITTAANYVAINTWYRVKITRTATGLFTFLIKGGAFVPTTGYDGWTLVSTTATDNTHTNSNYFEVACGAGDRIANIKLIPTIKQ